MVREKGTDRSRFLRGEVDKYTWQDHGSSYLPSEIQAAVLVAQLEAFAHIQARRHHAWDRYARELAGVGGCPRGAAHDGARRAPGTRRTCTTSSCRRRRTRPA